LTQIESRPIELTKGRENQMRNASKKQGRTSNTTTRSNHRRVILQREVIRVLDTGDLVLVVGREGGGGITQKTNPNASCR
jgi:hypothetical protein